MNRLSIVSLLFVFASSPTLSLALDDAVPAVNGHISRTLLGDGTRVRIAVIDSGVDDTHPSLTGNDSLGNPRMIAEANFVPTEPGNTGDDVAGHGTWVASAALSRGLTFTGMATDARFINARVIDSNNGFASDVQVRNGIGFAIGQNADVLNLSLNFFGIFANGGTQLDLMIDWAAFDRGISCTICNGNISQAQNGYTQARGPASAYNGVSVGRTTATFDRIHADSATAFTQDSRMKPDLVAPGTNLTLANDDWEGAAADFDTGLGGCSFAAPLVAGMMAQQIEAGRTLGLSTNPLVIKATMMNAAEKVRDKSGNPWVPANSSIVAGVFNTIRSLDAHSGAGQIDGAQLSAQYLAGEQGPGIVLPVGWDLGNIGAGPANFVEYAIAPALVAGSTLATTLTWNRHVSRTDNGNDIIDAADTFTQTELLDNLDLAVLLNGNVIAQSRSTLDNVEHLFIPITQQGQYSLRVIGTAIVGAGPEAFSLAWAGIPIPEPATIVMCVAMLAGLCLLKRRVRN